MRILVYGAGVLGSLLAHVLHRGGNDVTLLARGNRLDELRSQGLVIRHYLQLRTTTDRVALVDKLAAEDVYDLCFVVVQRQQLDSILPKISASTGCRDYVLVGNNPTMEEVVEEILRTSPVEKRLAFGFQSSGGRREGGRVISIHAGPGYMTLGFPGRDDVLTGKIKLAFANTDYRLTFSENMSAWLKCHAAFVLPIAFACYYADGDLHRVAWDKRMLNKILDAINDAYRMVKAAGYPIMPPEDDGFLERDRSKTYWLLKIMSATPVGKLAASDHAMSAPDEMRRLYNDFLSIKQKAGIDTPAWDEMAQYIQKY